MGDCLCFDCIYAEWDETGIGQPFISECKKSGDAETEKNRWGEVIECSCHELPRLEDCKE